MLIADDLVPAQVADLDTSRVTGLVLAAGSPTSHSAILARSRGIPAVVGAGSAVLDIPPGTTVALDGTTGRFFVDPSDETLRGAPSRRSVTLERKPRSRRRERSHRPSRRTGSRSSSAPTSDPSTTHRRLPRDGADLAGLVRTEFLYLGRDEAPTVDEQVEVYRSLAAALGGRRLTLRTLDVGGDKPLPYAPQPAEANPFLGMRGIRLALAQGDLLDDQLRAIVVGGARDPGQRDVPDGEHGRLSWCRRGAASTARSSSSAAGGPKASQVGIMVEVPAAALKAAAFAPHVDFFSIGTNDLTQYALAAERGNAAVAALGDPLDPGVLRLIESVCRAADGRCLVAVCGELAADESRDARSWSLWVSVS